jgi:hypothetical protein
MFLQPLLLQEWRLPSVFEGIGRHQPKAGEEYSPLAVSAARVYSVRGLQHANTAITKTFCFGIVCRLARIPSLGRIFVFCTTRR